MDRIRVFAILEFDGVLMVGWTGGGNSLRDLFFLIGTMLSGKGAPWSSLHGCSDVEPRAWKIDTLF
jgi:hypothetical protein